MSPRAALLVARAVGLALVAAAGALAVAPMPVAHGQVPPSPDGEEDPTEPPPPPSASAPAPEPLTPRAGHGRRGEPQERDGMVRVPGGTFRLGTADSKAPPNERPPIIVTLPPFWMDRTEVTVHAYRSCVEKKRCAPPSRGSGTCTYDAGDPLLPVTCVTWHDAERFCRAVGKRLPSEAEWEFAARGGSDAPYPWGYTRPSCVSAVTLMRETTSRSCGSARPTRVGTHPAGASPWGVLDMGGNVEEWTADFYVEVRTSSVPPRTGSSRVLRGGGWLSPPSAARATARNWGSAVEAGPNVGFRCARGA